MRGFANVGCLVLLGLGLLTLLCVECSSLISSSRVETHSIRQCRLSVDQLFQPPRTIASWRIQPWRRERQRPGELDTFCQPSG